MNILKDSSLNGNIIGKTQEKLFADELDRTGVIDHHLVDEVVEKIVIFRAQRDAEIGRVANRYQTSSQ